MKKIITIVCGVLLVGLMMLWLKGGEVKEIRTAVEIGAEPEKVWQILTDIQSWEAWSPIIKKSSGQAELGAILNITMCSDECKDGKDGPIYSPLVTHFNKPNLFRWRATMMAEFLFTNDKIFELEATPFGTNLVHKEQFTGIMLPLFGGKLEENVPKMLESMNDALKNKLEGG